MKKYLIILLSLFYMSCSSGEHDNNPHIPSNLVVNIEVNNGTVIASLFTRDGDVVNDPTIDIQLNGESLNHIYSEIDGKSYYTGTLEHGQTAVFAVAMDNREFLLNRTTMPGKIDASYIRVNILPNDNLEISWDHLGRYNKIKIYKAILLNPFMMPSDEPRITLADDTIEYDVKIGKGEKMLPPEWLKVEQGRLYELVMDIDAKYTESLSERFHPNSILKVQYEYEHHVDVSDLR